ncbi:GRP family sugar transporter [Larkinella bovis]|uniref:GRP family sugar transporter n=1 Tax=Larkinella bovis TaxID=683041 RepID=A0ABW0I9C1_9BACT
MFIIPSYTLAVLFCVVTMLCWGSWGNTQKLAASNWRFELFYWDYVIGVLLLSLLLAFTLGSMGEGGRSFLPDLQQVDRSNLYSALLGGVIFNLSNILLSAAISIAGMSVAFPVGVGLALAIGVVVNYLDLPVGNPVLIFGGVALIVLAIALNAQAYRKLAQTLNVSVKGLILAVVSGCLMGYFYKYVAASMFTDFSVPEPGKLSPYTAVVVFSVGIFLSNFVFNTFLMFRPFVGCPVTYRDYFQGSLRSHLMGILGGAIWCLGMSFSIIASDKAGTAISYGLGQGATVVAALWGIYVWREFRNAPKGTYTLLNLMLFFYVLGLSLLIGAR